MEEMNCETQRRNVKALLRVDPGPVRLPHAIVVVQVGLKPHWGNVLQVPHDGRSTRLNLMALLDKGQNNTLGKALIQSFLHFRGSSQADNPNRTLPTVERNARAVK
eukprot:6485588-Amphidinium_carterae.1